MAKKISYYRNKADKLLQEVGRKKYKNCLICGGKYNCLHHFFTKGSSSSLRYNWLNLIPICISCHSHHHWGHPEPHLKIVEIKGQEWVESLRAEKNKVVKTNIGYYKQIIEHLENELRA